MEQMNVITFKETGHVLGVATRASQPDTALTTEDIAKDGFLLRARANIATEIAIPEDHVGVSLVTYDPRPVYRPHLFQLVDGEAKQRNPGDATDLFIELDGTNVKAQVPHAVLEPTTVWFHIGGENRARSVTIPKGSKSGSEPMTVGAGDYAVAMFAPEYVTTVLSITVP